MIIYDAQTFKLQILTFSSLLSFTYDGIPGDVDPYNPHDFHMRYGDKEIDVHSIDEVMNTPFFNGKTLSDIAAYLQNVEL